VFLPRAEAEQADAAPAEGSAGLSGEETILLVEDEEMVRSLTEKLLSSRGYKVILADTPQNALRIAREYDGVIHLLLTDVVMPQMNGRELFLELDGIRPGIKVLYMSGYAADVIASHGVMEKDTSFVPKPFTAHALATKVREALEKEA
jgi:two-component system cell cycle sensor histidine kinase/response regulator CckA